MPPADRHRRRRVKPVAVALVWHRGRLVVGRRSATQSMAGRSEFPGGKVEPGETPEQAAVREVHEETGLEVRVLRRRREILFEYDTGVLQLNFFDCELVGNDGSDRVGVPDLPLTPPFRWTTADELRRLTFPDANDPLLAELLQRFGPG